MPKPLKKKPVPRKPKRPTDPNQLAHQLMLESTGQLDESAPAPNFKAQLSAYMSKLGTKGGQESGRRRMQNFTDEKRSAIALKAATARWAKRRKIS